MTPRLLGVAVLLALVACGDSTAPPTITSVAFDTDAVTLLIDDSVSTQVTVKNSAGETVSNPAVTYGTSEGSIASVDATGKVRAIAPGTATITATVGSLKDELQVTVNWPPVASVDLQIANADVFVEDTVPTTIAVLNSKGKTASNAVPAYATSDAAVATVDDAGGIIGVGNGTATITATAEGISDQLQITVSWPPVVSVAFNRDTATLLLDDSLAAAIVVMNSRGRVARNAVVTYGSSANAVATIDAAKIRTFGTGTATLSVTVGSFHDEIGVTVVPHFTSIALGEYHACGISGIGGLWCWGSDENGQLGQPQRVPCFMGHCSVVPVRVQGNQRFVSAAPGAWHTCALTDTGAAYCWGNNQWDQLGTGSTDRGDNSTPNAVAGGLTFTSLSAGRFHTCGITTGGDTYCWGFDRWGQLGTGVTPIERCEAGPEAPCTGVPIKVVGNHDFVEIAGTETATCGRTAAGAIYCWGFNVGASDSTECNLCTRTPVLQAGGATYSELLMPAGTSGYMMGMICGRSAAGAVSCWGSAFDGEFGNGAASTSSSTPVPIAGGAEFAQTVTGRIHLCARETNGAVKCWGDAKYGGGTQGPGLTPRPTPTPLGGGIVFKTLFGSPITGTTCGLSVAGRAYCWGDGRFGQLGNNELLKIEAVPAHVKLAR